MANAQDGQGARANEHATIRFGAYQQPGPFVGRSVGEVREALSTQWNLPADAKPFKGKEQLQDDYIIQAGDHIELHRQMGEKG